jgi:tetratricopeptide (TPR) repeat protein
MRFLTAAVALRPESPGALLNLGAALEAKGQVKEAIACFHKVIALDPKEPKAHTNLGAVLCNVKRDYDGAIACFKKAIELQPMFAEAHCNLGHALARQGRFAESLAAYRRGHELGTKRPGWRYSSAQWVRQTERLAALESKLPAFLNGELEPSDTAERLGLIHVCQAKKLHATAARLYADAFADDPKLADDLQAGHRYNAACSAALAGAALSEDAARLGKERTRLRKQALDWLRADLGQYTKRLEGGTRVVRRMVQQRMRHWQKDGDLAGLRDKALVEKLPADEQKAWTQIWSDVAALLKKAEEPAKKETQR